MSKVFASLFVLGIVIFYIAFLADEVLAQNIANYSASAITYDPKAFPANPSSITLKFRIENPTTLANLRDKPVRLLFPRSLIVNIPTSDVTITQEAFDITITDSRLLTSTQYTGNLEWKPNPSGDFTPLCSGIVYSIADPNICVIDPTLQSKYPPNSTLTIKFAGRPNTKYYLTRNIRALGQVETDNQGQGSFDNILLDGKNGVTMKLVLSILTDRIIEQCSKQITLDISALPPGTPPPFVTAPAPGAGVATPPPIPATAAGLPCDPGDPNNPGIRTAIGCIHTSLVGFIKDFLKFTLGIAGGLAFLMMLLGAFQMLTSAGNPDTLNAGKDRLTSAVIGLLFVIFAVLLLQIIGVDILGILPKP